MALQLCAPRPAIEQVSRSLDFSPANNACFGLLVNIDEPELIHRDNMVCR